MSYPVRFQLILEKQMRLLDTDSKDCEKHQVCVVLLHHWVTAEAVPPGCLAD